MIKELKAPSSSAASRLYTETVCFFTIITPVLEAHIPAHTSHEITIKSDSEISEQYL